MYTAAVLPPLPPRPPVRFKDYRTKERQKRAASVMGINSPQYEVDPRAHAVRRMPVGAEHVRAPVREATYAEAQRVLQPPVMTASTVGAPAALPIKVPPRARVTDRLGHGLEQLRSLPHTMRKGVQNVWGKAKNLVGMAGGRRTKRRRRHTKRRRRHTKRRRRHTKRRRRRAKHRRRRAKHRRQTKRHRRTKRRHR